jgi:tetrahydromethanopterin S-methyltransferase subunit F
VETTQEQVVKAAMAASHLEAAQGVVEELQQAAQVVEVRQVKLEFGVGNDIKQYNTNT